MPTLPMLPESGNPAFEGSTPVSLAQVLEERENRVRCQRRLLEVYRTPLISVTLNMPGPYKAFPQARRCFEEARRVTRLALEAEGLTPVYEEVSESPAGYAGFLPVPAPPQKLKALTLRIEETHLLGRLFDLDVLAPSGEKVSREGFGLAPRRCLVCEDAAFTCGRSRRHDLREVQDAALDLMRRFFRERLGSLVSAAALKAILYEVSVTPKPGLVDRHHAGAHTDMDFFTFIDSAAAILPYFRECSVAGFDSLLPPDGLFDTLRPGGKAAECLMNRATGNVNVHKGLIFSFAVVSAAYGRLYQTTDAPDFDALFSVCRAMTVRVHEDFSRALGTAHGEALYAQYGIQGIRGEAAAGFPTVRDYGYPALCRALDAGHSLNDAGIAAFFALLARLDDTNIVHRADITALREIQAETRRFLAASPSMEALRNKAAELDRRFTAHNISPGGCADMLGLSFFLYSLFRRE